MRDPTQRIYRRSPEDIALVIDRCFLDADDGRVEFAIARISDLEREFRGNAHVVYASGLLKRDYLGQASTAFAAFEQAYHAATLPTQKETRWFSLCNLISLAPDRETFVRWVDVAVRDYGPNLPETKDFLKAIDEMNRGSRYEEILSRQAAVLSQLGTHGTSAALLEIVLATPSLPKQVALEAHKGRAMSLRSLDQAEERARGSEVMCPEERLALHAALAELEKAINLDEYDATLWNFRSAWCILLRRYEEAVKYADEAIKLRPDGYHRPWHNKAHALHDLDRTAEAKACADELVRMTKAAPQSPADAIEAQAMLQRVTTPQSSPQIFVEGIAEEVLSKAQARARVWQERCKGMVTPQKAAQRLLQHEVTVLNNPIAGYVPLVAELLNDLTPEMAYLASLAAFQQRPAVTEYLIAAAVYVAAMAPGIERLDAGRYLVLMTLHLRDYKAIREYYRRSITVNAAAGGTKWSVLPRATRHALDRIHSRLAAEIIDNRPVTEAERKDALKHVLRFFEPGFVAPPSAAAIVLLIVFWLVVLGICSGMLAWSFGLLA